MVVGGFLFIVSNAVIADIAVVGSNSNNGSDDKNKNASKNNMGSILGTQAACISLAFLFGSVAGGRLTEYGERAAYGAALLFSVLATLNVAFRMLDSLELTTNTRTDNKSDAKSWDVATLRKKFLEAPLSSIQLLFHYGSHMRTLALLLLLQSAPIYMGDVFQLFAKEEWGLLPKDFAGIVGKCVLIGLWHICFYFITLILTHTQNLEHSFV